MKKSNEAKYKLPLGYIVIFATAICFSSLIGIYCILQLNKVKIACIDIPKVISKCTEIQEINKEFDAKEQEQKLKSDTLLNELQNEIKAFEKDLSQKKEVEKEIFSKKINTKHSQFLNYQEVNKNKLADKKQKALKKVLSKIDKIAKQLANMNGYKVIFGATGTGNVVYMSESIDISVEVLEKLNNE